MRSLFQPNYRLPQRCVALGGFLASSDSETADVECFVSATDLTPIDGGCEFAWCYLVEHTCLQYAVSTETYQAQYRVLESFSLINAILSACSSFCHPRSTPVNHDLQFWDSCCCYLSWLSDATGKATRISGTPLSMPLTGQVRSLRRLASCLHL